MKHLICTRLASEEPHLRKFGMTKGIRPYEQNLFVVDGYSGIEEALPKVDFGLFICHAPWMDRKYDRLDWSAINQKLKCKCAKSVFRFPVFYSLDFHRTPPDIPLHYVGWAVQLLRDSNSLRKHFCTLTDEFVKNLIKDCDENQASIKARTHSFGNFLISKGFFPIQASEK